MSQSNAPSERESERAPTMVPPPQDRRYSPDHVWISEDGRVGVTPYLLDALPRIEAVYLPSRGLRVHVTQPIASLEGEKGLLDIYSPCDGIVVDLNDDIVQHPRRLYTNTYDSWLVRVEVSSQQPLWSGLEYAAAAKKRFEPRPASSR